MSEIYEIYMRTPGALPLYEVADKTRNIIGRLRFKRFDCCFENAVFDEIDFGRHKKLPSDYPEGTDKPVLEQVIEDIVCSRNSSKIKLNSFDGRASNASFRIVSNFRNGTHIVSLSMCYGEDRLSALKYLFGGYTRTALLCGFIMPANIEFQPNHQKTDELYRELVTLFDPKALSRREL